jgi:gp53
MKLFEHKRHPDTTDKHKINKSEIEFLIDLQKELNTQTDDGNAQPVYWGIIDTKRIYNVSDDTDDAEPALFNPEYQHTLYGIKDVVDYIKDELNIYVKEYEDSSITVIPELKADENDKDNINSFLNDKSKHECLENEEDWMNFLSIYENHWYVVYYKDVDIITENLMFLTRQSAEDYLKENSHHHSENAHTYAMTAIRNPVVNKLWKILREVDFSKIENED